MKLFERYIEEATLTELEQLGAAKFPADSVYSTEYNDENYLAVNFAEADNMKRYLPKVWDELNRLGKIDPEAFSYVAFINESGIGVSLYVTEDMKSVAKAESKPDGSEANSAAIKLMAVMKLEERIKSIVSQLSGNALDREYQADREDEKPANRVEKVEETLEETVKVGDTLTMKGKKGKVTSVNADQATVDFGGGDSYGIVHRRIKDGIISEAEEAEAKTPKTTVTLDVNDLSKDDQTRVKNAFTELEMKATVSKSKVTVTVDGTIDYARTCVAMVLQDFIENPIPIKDILFELKEGYDKERSHDFKTANEEVHKVEDQWHYPILMKYGFTAETKEGIGFVRSYEYSHEDVTIVKCTTGSSRDYWSASKATENSPPGKYIPDDAGGMWDELEPYLKEKYGAMKESVEYDGDVADLRVYQGSNLKCAKIEEEAKKRGLYVLHAESNYLKYEPKAESLVQEIDAKRPDELKESTVRVTLEDEEEANEVAELMRDFAEVTVKGNIIMATNAKMSGEDLKDTAASYLSDFRHNRSLDESGGNKIQLTHEQVADLTSALRAELDAVEMDVGDQEDARDLMFGKTVGVQSPFVASPSSNELWDKVGSDIQMQIVRKVFDDNQSLEEGGDEESKADELVTQHGDADMSGREIFTLLTHNGISEEVARRTVLNLGRTLDEDAPAEGSREEKPKVTMPKDIGNFAKKLKDKLGSKPTTTFLPGDTETEVEVKIHKQGGQNVHLEIDFDDGDIRDLNTGEKIATFRTPDSAISKILGLWKAAARGSEETFDQDLEEVNQSSLDQPADQGPYYVDFKGTKGDLSNKKKRDEALVAPD